MQENKPNDEQSEYETNPFCIWSGESCVACSINRNVSPAANFPLKN
jgi:hypothetical protein